jgi:hypothetical protein
MGLDLPVGWKAYGTAMRVQVLHVVDCPNAELARVRVREAARRAGVAIDLREEIVTDERTAVAAGMRGSPTVLVGGRDVVTAAGETPALSCRLYRSDAGYDGAPPVDAIASAIAAAVEGGAGADSGRS